MKIDVAFSVELDEAKFRKVLAEAEAMGLNYGDAGKLEMARRFLIHNGIEGIANLPGLEGFDNYSRGRAVDC